MMGLWGWGNARAQGNTFDMKGDVEGSRKGIEL